MSRIGKKRIPLGDVKIDIAGKRVTVSGKNGKLEHVLPRLITAQIDDQDLVVNRANESRRARALHGLSRSLLANMVQGVTTGFKKNLEIQGVGYRAQATAKTLSLSLGYSHPVEFPIPDGITIKVADNTKLEVEGIDKQQVGQVAATIRGFRPPEPYKGKGIRYVGEEVLRKEGKSV